MPSQVDESIANPDRFLVANPSDNLGHSTESQSKSLVRDAARFDFDDNGGAFFDADKTLAAGDFWKELHFKTTAARTVTIPAGLGSIDRVNRLRIINDSTSSDTVTLAGIGTNVTRIAGSAASVAAGESVEISFMGNTNLVTVMPISATQGAAGAAGATGATGANGADGAQGPAGPPTGLTLKPVQSASYTVVADDIGTKVLRFDTGAAGSNGDMVIDLPGTLEVELSTSEERHIHAYKSSSTGKVTFTASGVTPPVLTYMDDGQGNDLDTLNDVRGRIIIILGKNESDLFYAHVQGWLDAA